MMDATCLTPGLAAGGGQVLAGDATLQLVPHAPVVPGVLGEELLERSDGTPGGQGNRIDALADQVAQQPAAVGAEVCESIRGNETGPKATQVLVNAGPRAATCSTVTRDLLVRGYYRGGVVTSSGVIAVVLSAI